MMPITRQYYRRQLIKLKYQLADMDQFEFEFGITLAQLRTSLQRIRSILLDNGLELTHDLKLFETALNSASNMVAFLSIDAELLLKDMRDIKEMLSK